MTLLKLCYDKALCDLLNTQAPSSKICAFPLLALKPLVLSSSKKMKLANNMLEKVCSSSHSHILGSATNDCHEAMIKANRMYHS